MDAEAREKYVEDLKNRWDAKFDKTPRQPGRDIKNLPDDFAFKDMTKIEEMELVDLDQFLGALQEWRKEDMVAPSSTEREVALVCGDDVVTGIHGEGLRLFPEGLGDDVKMWINEPFAAYRCGRLLGVYDPSELKFRLPHEEECVPERFEIPDPF